MTRLLCLAGFHDYHVRVNTLPSDLAPVITAMEVTATCCHCGKTITERHRVKENTRDGVATGEHKAGQAD